MQMMLILKAIFEHSLRLVALRHDGLGLPPQRGSTLASILALAAVSRAAAVALAPDAPDFLIQSVFFVIYFGLVWKLLRPVPMAAVLLIELAENLVLVGLYATSVVTAEHASLVRGALFSWALIALFVFFNRLVKRTAAAASKN